MWTLTSLNGTFSSPYYPHHYNNKASCKWNVRVPWNYTISLTFEHFALEKRCCACDYLEVWETLSNGTEVLIVTYCDAKNKRPHPSKQIRSRTSNMTVLFYSNEIKTAKGFKASYEAIPLFSGNAELLMSCVGASRCLTQTRQLHSLSRLFSRGACRQQYHARNRWFL